MPRRCTVTRQDGEFLWTGINNTYISQIVFDAWGTTAVLHSSERVELVVPMVSMLLIENIAV